MAIYKNTPPIVTNGLVLYADAANRQSYTSGSITWNDLSGNNNSGSLTNGPTFSTFGGGSIVFDGVNDFINMSSTPLFNFTSDLTLNTWIYNVSSSNGLGLITKGPEFGNFDYDYMLYITTNSTSLSLFKKNSAGVGESLSIGVTLLNRWVNICVTKQGTTTRFFINGVLNSTQNFVDGSIRTSPNLLNIGRGWNSAFAGNIPITQLYNRALTAQEVTQNYNATKTRFNLS